MKTEEPKPACFGKLVLPSSISVNNDAFGDYLKVAVFAEEGKRRGLFQISNEQKARIYQSQSGFAICQTSEYVG